MINVIGRDSSVNSEWIIAKCNSHEEALKVYNEEIKKWKDVFIEEDNYEEI